MAYVVSARPPGGDRTWTVVDGSYRTVVPVEEWLEAHRQVWSPNTVRGYATGLAQWWTFLEHQRQQHRPQPGPVSTDEHTDNNIVAALTAEIASLKRRHRTEVTALRAALEQAQGENLELRRQLQRRLPSQQPKTETDGPSLLQCIQRSEQR